MSRLSLFPSAVCGWQSNLIGMWCTRFQAGVVQTKCPPIWQIAGWGAIEVCDWQLVTPSTPALLRQAPVHVQHTFSVDFSSTTAHF